MDLQRHMPNQIASTDDFDTAFSRFSEEAVKYAWTVRENRLKLYALKYFQFLQAKAKGDPFPVPPNRFASYPASSLIRLHLNALFDSFFEQGSALTE